MCLLLALTSPRLCFWGHQFIQLFLVSVGSSSLNSLYFNGQSNSERMQTMELQMALRLSPFWEKTRWEMRGSYSSLCLWSVQMSSTWCHGAPGQWEELSTGSHRGGHAVLWLLHQSLLLPRASTKLRWSCQGLRICCLRKDTGRMGKSSNIALATLRNHLEAAPMASSIPPSRGYTTHLTCAFGTMPLLLLQGFKLRMGSSWSSDLCDSRQVCLCLIIPVW